MDPSLIEVGKKYLYGSLGLKERRPCKVTGPAVPINRPKNIGRNGTGPETGTVSMYPIVFLNGNGEEGFALAEDLHEIA
jgi:hypothetical protein